MFWILAQTSFQIQRRAGFHYQGFSSASSCFAGKQRLRNDVNIGRKTDPTPHSPVPPSRWAWTRRRHHLHPSHFWLILSQTRA